MCVPWKVAQDTEIVLKLLKNWLYFTEIYVKRLEAMPPVHTPADRKRPAM